jgi:hypothetical protein
MAKTKTTKKTDLRIVKKPAKKAEKERVHARGVDVLKEIRLTLVSEGPDKGMIRSDGMRKYNAPELLIPAGMPLYLAPVGASILNELADMIINGDKGKPFAAGHRVQIGPFRFRLKQRVYQDTMHWELSDEDMVGGCAHCGGNHGPEGHAG